MPVLLLAAAGTLGVPGEVARGGYRTKWDVLSAGRRFLVELEDGEAGPAEPVGPTVGEFLVEWLVASEPTRRPTTSVSYERCVRDHVIPHLGEMRLRELAPEHVRSWLAVLLGTPRRFRDGPLSTTTVRYCHRLLRRALQDALRWELIERNVCDAVVAPRRADTEMCVWSPPDVRRFLVFVADDRLVAMWRLFLVTGMRRAVGILPLGSSTLRERLSHTLHHDAVPIEAPSGNTARTGIRRIARYLSANRPRRTGDAKPARTGATSPSSSSATVERMAADRSSERHRNALRA